MDGYEQTQALAHNVNRAATPSKLLTFVGTSQHQHDHHHLHYHCHLHHHHLHYVSFTKQHDCNVRRTNKSTMLKPSRHTHIPGGPSQCTCRSLSDCLVELLLIVCLGYACLAASPTNIPCTKFRIPTCYIRRVWHILVTRGWEPYRRNAHAHKLTDARGSH